jgi:predicted DNA-binding transcriptional regulator AlpA
MSSNASQRYIRTADALRRYPVSRSTWHRLLERHQDFPRPVRLAGANLWPVAEVDQWFEGQRG